MDSLLVSCIATRSRAYRQRESSIDRKDGLVFALHSLNGSIDRRNSTEPIHDGDMGFFETASFAIMQSVIGSFVMRFGDTGGDPRFLLRWEYAELAGRLI